MIKDIQGKKFARLLVLRDSGERRRGQVMWLCLCDCGGHTKEVSFNLHSGNTKSCGCLKRGKISSLNYKHGQANKTRVYKSWKGMRERCLNKKHKRYSDWGGRGITICDSWLNSFEIFYKDMGDPPEGMSLGRINNDMGYSPENCRWETPKQQSNNRRPRQKR